VRAKAGYGEELLKRLGKDLSKIYGRGFGWWNLFRMRAFYTHWEITQAPSGRLQAEARSALQPEGQKLPTASAILQPTASQAIPLGLAEALVDLFPLPWSHYVRLLSVENPAARAFFFLPAIAIRLGQRGPKAETAVQRWYRGARSSELELSRGKWRGLVCC
jgi:hypothetical protein